VCWNVALSLGVIATFVISCLVMDALADEAEVVSGNSDDAMGKGEWTDPGSCSWTGCADSDMVRATAAALPSF